MILIFNFHFVWIRLHSNFSSVQISYKEGNNYESVLDLGTSIGTWYTDYRNFGFKKIIGIDISKERAEIAKKRGYDEVHVCNAYDLPFENETKNCVISNDVLVHVLQDSDKSKIFKEIKRVLKKNGIFIFNFANASGHGYQTDTTEKYCRWVTFTTIKNLLNDSKMKTEYVLPSYYAIPRIGAYSQLVNLSTKIIFPTIDYFLKRADNISMSKVVYVGVRKIG